MKNEKRALSAFENFQILRNAYQIGKRSKQKLSIYSLADLVSYGITNTSLIGKKVYFSIDGKLLKAESLTVKKDKIILECGK